MESYGERLQYSVFRCRLSATEFERLRWELTRVAHAEDEVLMIRSVSTARRVSVGLARSTVGPRTT
jgi:CRISPR-associated endonuclease Cas2